MNLHTLKRHPKAHKKSKRIGRGPGSGKGKTAGRGNKGQHSRSGRGPRPGFEGGQMPILRRIPKRGFTSLFKKAYTVINIGSFERFEGEKILGPELFLKRGMVKKGMDVKVLGRGELGTACTVRAHAFSASAKAKIEKAGGKIEVIGIAPR